MRNTGQSHKEAWWLVTWNGSDCTRIPSKRRNRSLVTAIAQSSNSINRTVLICVLHKLGFCLFVCGYHCPPNHAAIRNVESRLRAKVALPPNLLIGKKLRRVCNDFRGARFLFGWPVIVVLPSGIVPIRYCSYMEMHKTDCRAR